jgi:hypothetical protein
MKHSLSARPDQFAFDWLEPARKELARSAKRFVDQLYQLPSDTVILVSCGKHKKSTKSAASELYTSPRFQQSVRLAGRLQKDALILSAKHGLLALTTHVDPYDLSLSSLSVEQRLRWGACVVSKLTARKNVVLLAEDEYAQSLVEGFTSLGINVLNPLIGLAGDARLTFLKECHHYVDRTLGVEELYAIFDQVRGEGGIETLREALRRPLPEQGVYFFFDPTEKTRFSVALPRLVRVGTHGVSAGSRATLRDRLRTHFGTSDGYGNHRGSVFRLHVGEALIRRDGLRDRYPNWGLGQSSTGAVRDNERPLENKVSEIIADLLVGCVAVSDKSTKESARSLIERLSIALFTENFLPVEAPSGNWLGLYSKHEVIVKTGLWNLRDSGSKANLSIPSLISGRLLGPAI